MKPHPRHTLHRALLNAFQPRRTLATRLNRCARHNRAVLERVVSPEGFLERLFGREP